MLGIGFGEFALIFIVLIVVLGPERLPAFMKSVGTALRTLRQASRDIRSAVGFDELLRDPMSYQPPPRPRPPEPVTRAPETPAAASDPAPGTPSATTGEAVGPELPPASIRPRVEPMAGLTPTGGIERAGLAPEGAVADTDAVLTPEAGPAEAGSISGSVAVTQPLVAHGAPAPVAVTVAVGEGEGPAVPPSLPPPAAREPAPTPQSFVQTQRGPGPVPSGPAVPAASNSAAEGEGTGAPEADREASPVDREADVVRSETSTERGSSADTRSPERREKED